MVDAEQVCLSRRLDTKKDDYILNGKPITKSDAMKLLNKDGVSRNNLCYFVHHGKISSLTLMDDSGRLDLLKKISGAQFYEKQRLKSSNILLRTENERNRIHDLSQFLDERLRMLDEQRTKLKDYERQISVLEYCIYSKEITKAKADLEEMNVMLSFQKLLGSNLISEKKELRNLSSSLNAIKRQVGLQEEAKNLLQLVIKKHTELSNDIKFLDIQIYQNEEAEKELSNLSSEITRSKDSLEKIMAGYTDDATSIMSCSMTLDTSKDFSGEWLKELSKKCHHQKKTLLEEIRELDSDLKASSERISMAEKLIKKLELHISSFTEDGIKKLGNLLEKRKSLQLDESISSDKARLGDIETQLKDLDIEINDFWKQKSVTDLECWISQMEKHRQDCAIANDHIHDIDRALKKKNHVLQIVESQIKEIVQMETVVDSSIQGGKTVESTFLEKRDKTCASIAKHECDLTSLVRKKHKLDAAKLSDLEMSALKAKRTLKSLQLSMADYYINELENHYNDITININSLPRQQSEFDNKELRIKMWEDASQLKEHGMKEINHLIELKEQLLKKTDELAQSSDEYSAKTEHILRMELDICRKKFNMLRNVNKEALSEYESYKVIIEDLRQKGKSSDDVFKVISERFSELHRSKDKNIESTFTRFCKEFEKVFSELVDGGHGCLKMIEKKKQDGDLTDNGWRLEKYTGMEVKACFPGGRELSTRQLTRDQKTIVALALIFAMQKLDPVPIYLFDDIEATLEPQYHATLANVVRSFANSTHSQLITTISSLEYLVT